MTEVSYLEIGRSTLNRNRLCFISNGSENDLVIRLVVLQNCASENGPPHIVITVQGDRQSEGVRCVHAPLAAQCTG